MIPIHYIRLAQTLLVAAALTALAAPTFAHASSSSAPVPDWFERYAEAHPYGHRTADEATNPAVTMIDDRSPDTRDAADAARSRLGDSRSPDTIDVALGATVPVPDNVVQLSRFDWEDAGIGASATIIALAFLAGLLLLLTRIHRRPRVHTT